MTEQVSHRSMIRPLPIGRCHLLATLPFFSLICCAALSATVVFAGWASHLHLQHLANLSVFDGGDPYALSYVLHRAHLTSFESVGEMRYEEVRSARCGLGVLQGLPRSSGTPAARHFSIFDPQKNQPISRRPASGNSSNYLVNAI